MKYDYKDNELKGFFEWNKNYHLINKDDERFEELKKFKKENGFYPDECWNLYVSLCIFLLPRLKYFRDNTCGYPTNFSSIEEWKKVLDKMIWSFEEALKDEWDQPEQYYKDIQEGLNLFAEYFQNLWW